MASLRETREMEISQVLPGHGDPFGDHAALIDERFVAACRRDHPMAKLRRVTWAQLCDYDYISVGRSSGNRVLFDQALAGVAKRPQAIYEAQHVTTTLGLVEAGLGVAVVPSMRKRREEVFQE